MGSGKYLKRAIKKHGLENFEKQILFVFDNPSDMYIKETEIVNEDFITNENTYNLKIGGQGGFDHLNKKDYNNPTHSLEHMKKIRNFSIKKYKEDPKYRIKQKQKFVEMVRQRHKDGLVKYNTFENRIHSKETKKKMSFTKKGKIPITKKDTEWITNGFESKKIKKGTEYPFGYHKGRVMKQKNY